MGDFGSNLQKNFASSLGSSLGGGIGGIAGSAISGIFDMIGQAQQRKHEKAMQERQAEINREAFDYEFNTKTAYENPAAERARLEAAGLNPALIYSGGAGGSSISASTINQGGGSSGAGATSIGQSSSMAGNPLVVEQSQLFASQIDTQEALADKARAEAEEIRSRIPDSSDVLEGDKPSFGQLQYLRESNKYLDEIYGMRLKAIETEVKEATTQTAIETAQANLNRILSQIENDKNVSDSLALKYKTEAQDIVETQKSRIRLNEAKASERESAVDVNESQADLNRSLKAYWDKMPDKVKAEASYLTSRANLTDEQAREVKNLIALRWSQFGVDTAQKISHEAREWMYGWIPLRRQGKKLAVDMDKVREETRRLKNENDFWDLNH